MTLNEESLKQFRRHHGLEPPHDPHWLCKLGPFALRLPNFAWRRKAIMAHDMHHILTGYPLTIRGEIQMAAWEWGAGRFPDWRATLFCTPLIALGLVWLPRRTWTAFKNGRRSVSLYRAIQ